MVTCSANPPAMHPFLRIGSTFLCMRSTPTETQSMSSIKRDVKKKTPPSTGGREDLCLDIQPTVSTSVPGFGNHRSIGGSWPIAISDYPRGHSVRMVTRCRSTRGPADRLILALEPSISRTRPATTSEITKDGKNRSPETLKLLADLIVWRRSPPFLPRRQSKGCDLPA
jgi:hypothetical protein